MNISVVVPVWNGRELLGQLLDSVRAQTCPAAEVIAVDNGSTDGAPELARNRGARVVEMGRNTGFATAVNRGIAEARGEWIAVLNSDVTLAPDYFEKLASTQAWFATGKLLSASDTTRIDGSFDLVCRGGVPWRAGNGMLDAPQWNIRRGIWSAPWTAALFRAELFQKCGVLDEAFESYLEDVDFGLRCARLGFSGEYIPDAVAWHQGSASLGRWNPRTVRAIARNQLLLLARHYSRSVLMRNVWHITVAHLLWGIVAVRHGAGSAWVKGRLDGHRLLSAEKRHAAMPFDSVLLEHLCKNDRIISELQSPAGDRYWSLYFLLTGGAK